MKVLKLYEVVKATIAILFVFTLSYFSLLMPSGAFAAGAMQHEGKDSFLAVQPSSVSELANEVAGSLRIRANYAKLYHMSPVAVVAYFRRNLEIMYLKRSLSGPVYCVTPAGRIYLVHETLKAGDRIFALADGRPILKGSCGNPLTATLPAVAKKAAQGPVNGKRIRSRAALTPSVSNQARLIGQPIQLTSAAPATSIVVPTEQVLPYTATFPTPASGPDETIAPASFSFSSDASPLSLIGLLPFFFGSSNSSSNPAGNIAAAPECSSLYMWLLAIPAMLWRLNRDRQNAAGQLLTKAEIDLTSGKREIFVEED